MNFTPSAAWRKKHFNRPQRRSMIVRAKTEVAVMARGVGKTEGIIAPRLVHNAYAMKRSLGALVIPSYRKLFTELMPSLYNGLDGLGLVEGKHYHVGNGAPSKWPKPYNRVRDWRHAIRFNCGSAAIAISQDRPGMGNGLSTDYHILEEAKLLNGPRYEDSVSQTMRGNIQHFGGMSEYQSLLIVSDRPTSKKQKWFMKYRDLVDKEMEETIELIIQSVYRQQVMIQSIRDGGLSARTVQDYQYKIEEIERELVGPRSSVIHYHEASALDNIDIVGWPKFLAWEATMNPRLFNSSILNLEEDIVEGAWYSEYDEEKHTYEPAATSWTTADIRDRDRLIAKDCRRDAETVTNLPLDIGMDYGGRFNCMVVGQLFSDLFRIENAFHAHHPTTTQDVVKQFIQYYLHHKNKTVYFYFDHTALDKHGTSPYTYYQTVYNTLIDAGWNVIPVDIGYTQDPKQRYEMFSSLFRQAQPPIMFNPINCVDLLTSLVNVQILDGKDGIKKNKNAEGKVPLEEEVLNPHYSDALDTLVWGRLQTMSTFGSTPSPSFFTG